MPTSTKTAKECCRDLGVDPELWWGRVNNYILDGYHQGVADARAEARNVARIAASAGAEAVQAERERTRDAEQAAARAGAEAGALRVEVRRLCERVEELEALAAGKAA